MLVDHEIEAMIRDGVIGYAPYNPDYLNPASVDMTLHPMIRVPALPKGSVLDMREVQADHTASYEIPEGGYVIRPGEFLLASTVEWVKLPDDMVSRVEGKSSIGRVGLAVHITAGFIDPGFEGQVTLEIANLSPWAIKVYPHMRIAQMAFTPTESAALKPYSATGHYTKQTGPTESRYRIPERCEPSRLTGSLGVMEPPIRIEAGLPVTMGQGGPQVGVVLGMEPGGIVSMNITDSEALRLIRGDAPFSIGTSDGHRLSRLRK